MKKKVIVFNIVFTLTILTSCNKNKTRELQNINILQSKNNFHLNSIAYGIKDEIKSKNIDVNINEYNIETGNLSVYEIASKIKNKKDIIITVGDSALSFAVDAFPTNPIIACGIIDTKALNILKTSRSQNGNISGVYYIADFSLYIEDLLKIFNNINSIGYIEYSGFKYSDIIEKRIKSGAKLNNIKYMNYHIDDILNAKEELKIKKRSVDVMIVINNIPIPSVYEYTLEELAKNNIPAISFEPILDFTKPILFSIFPNYYRMGRVAADMIIEVLEGNSIENIEIINMTTNSSIEIIVNKDIAKKFGIRLNENIIEILASKVIEDGKIKSVIR